MFDDILTDASRRCAQVPSFGEVLDAIRNKRDLSQKELGERIFRSEAEVSRLLNNQIPQKMRITDVYYLAYCIYCSNIEVAQLIAAFVCYILSNNDLLDYDET
jgi:transcriptional regulator with XRE-family HTH domain